MDCDPVASFIEAQNSAQQHRDAFLKFPGGVLPEPTGVIMGIPLAIPRCARTLREFKGRTVSNRTKALPEQGFEYVQRRC